ncbi:unnamed protein product, partial [Laminaria digitata]
NTRKELQCIGVSSCIIMHPGALCRMDNLNQAEPNRRTLRSRQPRFAADQRRLVVGRIGEPVVILCLAAPAPAAHGRLPIVSRHAQRAAGIVADHRARCAGQHRPAQHGGV